jgi:hypothetical protein
MQQQQQGQGGSPSLLSHLWSLVLEDDVFFDIVLSKQETKFANSPLEHLKVEGYTPISAIEPLLFIVHGFHCSWFKEPLLILGSVCKI